MSTLRFASSIMGLFSAVAWGGQDGGSGGKEGRIICEQLEYEKKRCCDGDLDCVNGSDEVNGP